MERFICKILKANRKDLLRFFYQGQIPVTVSWRDARNLRKRVLDRATVVEVRVVGKSEAIPGIQLDEPNVVFETLSMQGKELLK